LNQPEIYQVLRRHQSRQPVEAGQKAGHLSRPLAPLIPVSDPPRAAVDRFAERWALVFDSLPVLCRDAELEADALGHPKPGAGGQLGLRR